MEKIKYHFYDELLSKDEFTCSKNIADDAMLRNEFLAFLLKNDYKNFCPNHCDLPRHFVTLEDFRNYSLHKNMGDANTSQQLTETIFDKKKVLKTKVPENGLLFRAGCTETIDKEFIMTSYGCYICQQNFISLCKYDDHIKFHGKDEDMLPPPTKWFKCWHPTFTISYDHCVDTNLLNFKIIADKDIVIEKIVIVRPEFRKLMHHVERSKIQISKENRTFHLAVDCFLFDVDKEQPLFVIYRCCNEAVTRKVEKYIFFRKEQFPKSNISIISSSVPQHAQLILKYKLAQHFPAIEIRDLYKKRYKEEFIIKRNPTLLQYLLERKLKETNYTQVLSFLLQMEDQFTLGDYEKFTLTNPAVKYLGRLDYSVTFSQEIKNTSDKFLVQFDEVVVSPCYESYYDDNVFETNSGKKAKQKCFGYIYKVKNNTVFFTLRTRLYIWKERTFKIKFYPHRIPFRYQYEAIQRLAKYKHVVRVLLPPENVTAQISPVILTFFNKSVENNPEQSQAVRNIVSNSTTSVPYILFGPPGTGKSTTVVESVLQLWRTKPLSRILVTSGSNTACDEVAKRLCKVFEQINGEGPNLLRIYAVSYERKMDNSEELLVEASNFAHGYHFYPSLDSIYLFRIVVATLSICGKLVQGAISDTHFSHIFIDECAASTEPEALVGIVGLMGPKTKLILSGDPKQLGAVLKSEEAEILGLGISMMERLLSMKCYAVNPKTHEYDRSLQTILRRNFRSNVEILSISNELCYNSQLLACAKPNMTDWAKGWNKLPVKDCPILFHVVHGQTVVDKGETSSRNLDEMRIVLRYVRDLMKNGINGRKVSQKEIGIISPYKRQYTLIREALNSEGLSNIETGSAENFQGREKPIIIISTVKSLKNIGFLKNVKRLNVMLTRAQALMIIVGNPETLQKDNNWYQVLKHFEKQKAFKGQAFKLKPAPNQFNVDLLPSVPKVCNDIKNKEPDSQKKTSGSKIEKYVDTDREEVAFKMNSQNSQQHNIAANCQLETASNLKAENHFDSDRQEVTDYRMTSFAENLQKSDQDKKEKSNHLETTCNLDGQEEPFYRMAPLLAENPKIASQYNKDTTLKQETKSDSATGNYIDSSRQKEAAFKMTSFAENLQSSDQDNKEKSDHLETTSNLDRQEEPFYRMAPLLAENLKIASQYNKDTTLKQETNSDSATGNYIDSSRQTEAAFKMTSFAENLQNSDQDNKENSDHLETTSNLDRQEEPFYRMAPLLAENPKIASQYNKDTTLKQETKSDSAAGNYIDSSRQKEAAFKMTSFAENLQSSDQDNKENSDHLETTSNLDRQEEAYYRMASVLAENSKIPSQYNKDTTLKQETKSDSATGNYIDSDPQKEAAFKMTSFAENLQSSDQDKKEKSNHLETTSNLDRQEEAYYRMASVLAENSKIPSQYNKDTTLKQETKSDSATGNYIDSDRQKEAAFKMTSFAENLQSSDQDKKEKSNHLETTSNLDRQEEAYYRMASVLAENLKIPSQYNKDTTLKQETKSDSATGNYIDSDPQKEAAFKMTSFAENLQSSDQDKKEKSNHLETTSNLDRQEEAYYRMASVLAENSKIPSQYNKGTTLNQEIKSNSAAESYFDSNRQEEVFYRMASLHVGNLQSPQRQKKTNCQLKSTSNSATGNYIDLDPQKDFAFKMTSFAENLQNSDQDKKEKSNHLETTSNLDRQEEAYYRMASVLAENSKIPSQYNKGTTLNQEIKSNSAAESYFDSIRQEEAFYKMASLHVGNLQSPQRQKKTNCQLKSTSNSATGNYIDSDPQKEVAFKMTSFAENLQSSDQDKKEKSNHLETTSNSDRPEEAYYRMASVLAENSKIPSQYNKGTTLNQEIKSNSAAESYFDSNRQEEAFYKMASLHVGNLQSPQRQKKTNCQLKSTSNSATGNYIDSDGQKEAAFKMTSFAENLQNSDQDKKEKSDHLETTSNSDRQEEPFYRMAPLLAENSKIPSQYNKNTTLKQEIKSDLATESYFDSNTATVRPMFCNDINKETNWQQQTTSNPKTENRKRDKISNRENEEINAIFAMASLELEDTGAYSSNLNAIHQNIVEPQIHKRHSNVGGDVGANRVWLEDTFCKQPALVLGTTVHSNVIEAPPQNRAVFDRPTSHAPSYEEKGENQGSQTYEDYQPSHKMLPPNHNYVSPKAKDESNCVIL